MAMPNRKPPPDFIVRLVGAGIRPWAVPMRTLARVLDATQRLVDQRDEDDRDDSAEIEKIEPGGISEAEKRILKLVDVKYGSAAYGVAAPDRKLAIGVIASTGKGIESPGGYDWTAATLSSLKELSEVAKSLGCNVEIRDAGKNGDVLATITPLTYAGIESAAFIKGTTSVAGKIERVGGATEMHCALRVPNQVRMLICRVTSDELVRQLGQHIYQTVVVSGEATWLRRNWHLKTVEITRFEPPKSGSILSALDEIYEAGGRAWDKIKDPDAYIAGMRK